MRKTLALRAAALVALVAVSSCAPPPSPAAPQTLPPTALAVASPTSPQVAEGEELLTDVSLSEAIDLSGMWRCQVVQALTDEIVMPEYDDAHWPEVEAPASWSKQGMADLVGQAKVVVYRRRVEVPASWQGQTIGISAWFNSHDSLVFVNGQRVDPLRKPFAPYADVSALLRYGEKNTIAVTSLYDGLREMAEAGPPRLGRIVQRNVTRVLQEDLVIDTPGGPADGALLRPAAASGLPAIVIVATGSHGMGEKTEWLELAADLARQGYAVLPVALKVQDAEGVLAAVRRLRTLPAIDPARIALVGADRGARPVVQAASQDTLVRGVALISTPAVDEVAALGPRHLLLLVATGDQRGRALEEARKMATLASGPCRLVELPGDGHGSYLLTSAWNTTREALLDWLKESLANQ